MIGGADEITITLIVKPLVLGLLLAFAFSLLSAIRPSGHRYLNRLILNARKFAGYSMPIVMLGFVSGYLTGISRTAAVGNLIPAMLTLVGGFAVYLFKTSGKSVVAIGYCIFVFGFFIFYGIQVGAFERQYKQVDRLIFLSDQERQVRNYRYNHDLPTDPADWILGGSK
jgi:hypothetical protein